MIRAVLVAASALVLAAPAPADDKPKPNTLTPKEIADGWIMLFDGETTFGWKLHPESKGEIKIDHGKLVVSANKGPTYFQLNSPIPWHYELLLDFEVEGRFTLYADWKGHSDIRVVTKQPNVTGLRVVYAPPGHPDYKLLHQTEWLDAKGKVVAAEKNVGQGCGLFHGPKLHFSLGKGDRLAISSIKLRPLTTTPLFNGKDLTGWKVFQDPKRNKSVFSVTREGELSVKNGPGDLQTEKKFDNFVLQLECMTNGKHLNSGIFFRCMENQYQNGYEAQIQNGYIGTDRTKPLDYGTGAIYRRVAARKVVSNDNEWFTMTVVANGPHIATWVNGYQTVDWTDDRKPSDNPRQGLRTAAGHISIQGHDPTTDLLFRNIRIAELAPAKK